MRARTCRWESTPSFTVLRDGPCMVQSHTFQGSLSLTYLQVEHEYFGGRWRRLAKNSHTWTVTNSCRYCENSIAQPTDVTKVRSLRQQPSALLNRQHLSTSGRNTSIHIIYRANGSASFIIASFHSSKVITHCFQFQCRTKFFSSADTAKSRNS
jgi:hypothetical protein